MRQYIVEGLLSDPENVVVDVEFLTPRVGGATQHHPFERERYEHHWIALNDPKVMAILVSDLAPHAIINLTTANVVGGTVDPTPGVSSKILATTNLLGAAYAGEWETSASASDGSQPRFIQVSSADCLNSMSDKPVQQMRVVDSETDPLCPDDAVVVSRLIEQARIDYGLSVINVIVSNTFGPYQNSEYFVPHAIETMLRQQTLRVQCDTRSWVFVEDAADAVIFLSQQGTNGRSYAVDSIGGRYSDLGLAELICDQLDQIIPCGNESYRDYLLESPAVTNSYPNDPAGGQQLHEEFGWKPLNDFHCALAATVRWHVEQSRWREQSSLIAGEA